MYGAIAARRRVSASEARHASYDWREAQDDSRGVQRTLRNWDRRGAITTEARCG